MNAQPTAALSPERVGSSLRRMSAIAGRQDLALVAWSESVAKSRAREPRAALRDAAAAVHGTEDSGDGQLQLEAVDEVFEFLDGSGAAKSAR